MPANGNAGWIDEALASWIDHGSKARTELSGSSMMAGHPLYTRRTDTDAYTFGANFMELLNGKLAKGLDDFLKQAVATKKFQPYTTEDFISWMEAYTSSAWAPTFKQYVYQRRFSPGLKSNQFLKDAHSHKMTVKEMQKFI
jgi:hypothetical protein